MPIEVVTSKNVIGAAPVSEPAATATSTEPNSAPAGETQPGENAAASEPTETDPAQPGDEGDADPAEKTGEPKPGKKGGFQKRIDKLTSKATQLEQEKEFWRQQALRTQPAEQKAPATEPKSKDQGKPDPDKFANYAEYEDAVIGWRVQQELAKRDSQKQESDLRSEHQKMIDAHQKRAQEFAAKKADYEDVIETIGEKPMSPTLTQVVLGSERGPEIMYELAKTEGEFDRINSLPAIAAALELGKIEARLIASSPKSPAQTEKTTTKAPPPIRPVGTNSAGAVEKSIFDADLSQADYEALRAKKSRRA